MVLYKWIKVNVFILWVYCFIELVKNFQTRLQLSLCTQPFSAEKNTTNLILCFRSHQMLTEKTPSSLPQEGLFCINITFPPFKQIFANLLCINSCQALQIKEIQNFDMVVYFILRIFSKNCSENISLVKSYVLFSSLSEVISVFYYLTAHILTLPLSLSLQHHRDVSTLRSTYCSSRDNLFSSQHPYHIGQPIALCNSSFRSSNALFLSL